MKNRSVPTGIVLAHITYRSIPGAIAWLTRVFGFQEHYRYGDPANPDGLQAHLGDAWIMIQGERANTSTPAQLGRATQSLSIFVDDVDAHFQHAKSQAATILEDLHETIYGERQYVAEDLDGHRWLFSQHVHDVNPSDWGATIAGTTSNP